MNRKKRVNLSLVTGLICFYSNSDINTGPFRRFSTLVWQNACANTVRRAMVCDAYVPFSKTL